MHVLETYLNRLHEIRLPRSAARPNSPIARPWKTCSTPWVAGSTRPFRPRRNWPIRGRDGPISACSNARSGDLRGAVEVKPVADDVPQTADGRQVARYWKHYGCVLVTNYRDFLLVVKEPGDKTPRVEGRYRLAADEETFWRAKPHALAKQHGEGLLGFSRRRDDPHLADRPARRTWPPTWPGTPARPNAAWPSTTSRPSSRCKTPWNRPSGCTSRATRARPSSAPRWCRRCSTASSPAGCSGGRTAAMASVSIGRGPASTWPCR